MGAPGSWKRAEHSDVLGFEIARLWPRLRHGRRRDALGLEEGGDYTVQTSRGEVGIEGEAHGECSGGLGELEEATERVHGRRGSQRTEVEEDGDGGAAVRPGLLDLAERSGMMWRSSCTGRGSEGEAVDTATTSGGEGSARLWERERERARQGERGVVEMGPWGLRGNARGAQALGGKQEVAHGGARASGTRPSSWQRRKTTGEVAVVGWAGQLQCWAGWWAAQVRPGKILSLSLSLSLSFIFCFFYFFCNFVAFLKTLKLTQKS